MVRQRTLGILLFIVSAVWFYLRCNSLFFYQEQKSLFIFSTEYLRIFTSKPGGLLEYLSDFMTQFYYSAFSGALIVSLFLMLIYFAFLSIYRKLSSDSPILLVFIVLPYCFSLISQKNFDYALFNIIGYLLTAVWLYLSVLLDKKQHGLYALVLYPVLFYLAGNFTFLYLAAYIIYSVVYQKGSQRFAKPAAMTGVAILTMVLFKEFLFLQSFADLVIYPLQFLALSTTSFQYFLIGYLILFPLIIKLSDSLNKKIHLSQVFRIYALVLVIAITGMLLSKPVDPDRSEIVSMEKSAIKKDWDAIILYHESTPSVNIAGQFYYNLALSEKGQLCDRLFYSRQDFGTGALILPHDDRYLDRDVYFYYSIGLTGEANHLAVESMVNNGYCPENIKFLIKTELINRHYIVAQRFIDILKKTLHYRHLAARYENMISDTTLVASDPELGEKIRQLPVKDFFFSPVDKQNVEMLLESNPQNLRAFEYHMAGLLFEKDLETIFNDWEKMAAGYKNIPRYIEEALILAKRENVIPAQNWLKIDPGAELRFKQYSSDYIRNEKNDPLLLKENMRISWGDTFWYYYDFR